MANVTYCTCGARDPGDTCVIYGVDPRSDPQYRQFRSEAFQVEAEHPPERRGASGLGEGSDGAEPRVDGNNPAKGL